ncbi:hypothetical protein IW261DRAFT_1425568 [Armillaria novae-zelandiae]|uniref:ATP-dependent RNA helicase n=1 Tax=Armillaria novae-zelandiae TaxID=153914 RepID=A0AA39NSA7_9AGAR|nr:hypothetical protein IW261DRAFT_1425568 [Armillaria novae-zelandiae]
MAAFAIPILQKLWVPQGLFACILSPTHELAHQFATQFEALGAGMGVRYTVLDEAVRLVDLDVLKAMPNPNGEHLTAASRHHTVPALLQYYVLYPSIHLLLGLVVDFDVPVHSKDYIHRVGRTARAGRAGKATMMVTQYDVEISQWVEYLLEKKLEEWPTDKADALVMHPTESQRMN